MALALLFLAGCGIVVERDGPPRRAVDSSRIPDAVPRAEPKSRYGNPESYVVNGKRYYTLDSSRGFRERGIASWYGRKFHGRRTSSGEVYDMNTMTAAHKSLPLPTYVEVTELTTGRRVVVRVNDRGPFYPNRVIDLSYAAARKLGISERGTGLVEIRAIEPGVVAVASAPAESRRIGRDNVRMYLQIGAFVSRANAERLQARIRNMVGVAIRVTPAVSGGRSVYRVRLGPLVDVEHADRVAEQIARFGLGEPRVVIE